MKQAKQKRLLAILLMFTLCFTMLSGTAFANTINPNEGYNGEILPAGPVKNGDIWIVTPENAQYTLDGAYGSINGKTIHFSSGVYSKELVLARSTKYAGSNTIYYNMTWNNDTGWQMDADPVDLENLNNLAIKTYMRTVENITFTTDDGVVLPGFQASSGHVYQNEYDYVRDIAVPNSTNSYYMNSSMKNITFDGLTIQNQVLIGDYSTHAVNSGIHFQNCTFMGNKSNMGTATYSSIRMMSDKKQFENVTVSNCTITNYFQGIYIQGAISPQITNNMIDGTTHNAIALQSSTHNPIQGSVVIKENIIKNARDRAIRFGQAANAEKITVQNNIILNSGDENGELFKGESFPHTEKVSLEHNYWNGEDVATAIANANADIRPKTIGIVGGTFPEEVKLEYCGEGFVPTANKDGTYGVCNHERFDTEVKNRQEPTCTEKGYTGDTFCTNCGILIAKGEDIEPTGHHYGDEWKSGANGHWHECSCGDKSNEAAHTFQWVIDKESTATEKGSKHEECSVCGYKKEAVEIPATPTTPTKPTDPAKLTDPSEPSNPADPPKTGDNSNLTLWISLFLLTSGGLVGTVLYAKKRKTN